LEDAVAILQHRQHHDLHRRTLLFQPANALNAVHSRQLNVHKHDVGLLFQQPDDSFLGVRTGSNTLKSGRALNQIRQALSDRLVILDDSHLDGRGRASDRKADALDMMFSVLRQ
jgi:hypothetical protein